MKNKTCGRIIYFVFLIMQIILSCAASFFAFKPIYFSNNQINGIKAIIGLTLLSFTILLNLFFIKKLRVRYEVRSRFAYDSINQRFFDLDNKLNSGRITENECKHLKSYIRFDLDFTYALRILYYWGAAFNFVEIIFVIISVVRKLIILKEPVFDKSYNTTIICLLVQTCWFMLFSQPFVYDLFNAIKGFSTLICFPKNGITIGIKELKNNRFLNINLFERRIGDKFTCTIRFGNLLTNKGDILLCPLGEGFKPANPLAHWVVEKEDINLEKILQNCDRIDIERTDNTLFIPCKKLKYRGILFVGVDFHSENIESINAKRIAEALSFVKKKNYSKLSCPEDFLYSPQVQAYRDLFNELNRAIMETKEDEKINFEIEFILKRNLTTYSRYADYEWIFES